MTGRLILVTGGTRSGKSGLAEALLSDATSVTYIATGVADSVVDDPEMAQRIAAHQAVRPDSWRTVEAADVTGAIATAGDDVLVDSVGTWVQARMDALDLWESGDLTVLPKEAVGWVDVAPARIVVVAEHVGDGLIATDRASRRWVDAVGMVNAALSSVAERAILVVAGRPVELPATSAAAPRIGEAPRVGEGPQVRQGPQVGQVPQVGQGPRVGAADDGAFSPASDLLGQHGDTMVPDGALDLAVNVRAGRPPAHVRQAIGESRDTRYPDMEEAMEAIAGHAGLTVDHVVLLAGAAEAFWLLPHALRPKHAAVIHPTFTGPEAALRACEVPVTRVPRDASAGWRLRPDRVPEDADFVVLGNPNNPTGTLDEASDIVSLCRPGRTVVVDEAFMDFVVDGRSSLLGRVDQPGLVVVRSVTKMWSIPGVRAGYLVAAPDIAGRLRRHQQPWPVSAAAIAATTAAVALESWRIDTATGIARRRQAMIRRLERIDGVTVHDGAANFVLVEVAAGPSIHRALLARGVAVRPSTFPLLPSRYLRVSVADAEATERLAQALEEIL